MKKILFPLLVVALLTMYLGNRQMTSGNYNRAAQFYRAASSIDFADLSAHPEYNLGVAYYKSGEYKKSIDEFENATKIIDDPKSLVAFRIYYNLGVSYYKYAESEAEVLPATELRELLCTKSIGAFNQALAIDSGSQNTKHNIAFVTAVCEQAGGEAKESDSDDESDPQEEDQNVKNDDIEKIKDREEQNKEDLNRDDYNKHDGPSVTKKDKPYW